MTIDRAHLWPALASLALGGPKPLVYVLSLLVGTAMFALIAYRSASARVKRGVRPCGLRGCS